MKSIQRILSIGAIALTLSTTSCDFTKTMQKLWNNQNLKTRVLELLNPERAEELVNYDTWQQETATETRIDYTLAKAVRLRESSNDPLAISATGAVGLMQLMPTNNGQMYTTENYTNYRLAVAKKSRKYKGKKHLEWAAEYRDDLRELVGKVSYEELIARDQRFDDEWNIREGTQHLARDMGQFKKKYPQASDTDIDKMTVAAYFTGLGRVSFKKGKVRIPKDTQKYVADVLKIRDNLR
jgi:hypothetical protein